MIAWSLMQASHESYLKNDKDKMRPDHEAIAEVLKGLRTKSGTGQIVAGQAAVIAYDDWKIWCEDHVEQLCAQHPDSDEAKKFREQLLRKMMSLRTVVAGTDWAEIVDLGFHDGKSQFVFAYVAAVCRTDGREIHVITSGFGNLWEQEAGFALDRAYWTSRLDQVRNYVKFGALEKLLDTIQRGQAVSEASEPLSEQVPGDSKAVAPVGDLVTDVRLKKGLTEVFASAKLSVQNKDSILRWCCDNEASELGELHQHIDAIAVSANMQPLPKDRFLKALRKALISVSISQQPRRPPRHPRRR